MNRGESVLSVTQVNRYIKMLMDSDDVLSYVTVRGEISNLKYHTSGHLYFTLKDEESEIPAVMFRSAASTLRFAVKNGMRVTVYGKISVYEKSGRYQVYASAMTDDGIGALYLEYQRLHRALAAEGLFDESRKRPLPKYPKCIGIITSPTGAAVRDMLNITGRRYPSAKILLYPSLVQGKDAPASLCMGLEYLNAASDCDVIIIGRGGGSIEDLWAFNDEALVRAVAASRIPVISAVGHETDYTLCDFAADQRAPTPSAAAELAVPDRRQLLELLDETCGRMDLRMEQYLDRKKMAVSTRGSRLALCSPEASLARIRQAVTTDDARMARAMQMHTERGRLMLSQYVEKLNAMNPLRVLERGYSVVSLDGAILNTVKGLAVGDRISLRVSDGVAEADIVSVTPDQKTRKTQPRKKGT